MQHPISLLKEYILNPAKFFSNIDKNKGYKYIFIFTFLGITLNAILLIIIAGIAPSNTLSNILPPNTVSTWREAINQILGTIIVLSFVEELTFRGAISNRNEIFKKIGLAFAIFFTLFNLQSYSYTAQYFKGYFKFGFLFIAIAIALVVPLFIKIKTMESKRFIIIFTYLQAFLFAFAQFNLSTFSTNFSYVLAPFVIFLQLYIALAAGFLASNIGFFKAVLFNILNNIIFKLFIFGISIKPFSTGNILFLIGGILLYLYCVYVFLDETMIVLKSKNNSKINIHL